MGDRQMLPVHTKRTRVGWSMAAIVGAPLRAPTLDLAVKLLVSSLGAHVPIDPRTPVLVGGGQVNQRDGEGGLEPVDLVVAAARLAADDAAAGALLAAIDSVRIVSILSWRYRDPGALVAARLGASPRHTAYSGAGGNTPQSLVNGAARDIAAGAADVVLIGGGEAWRTRMRTRASDERPGWTVQGDDVAAAEVLGADVPMSGAAELQRGIVMPVQVYPMFEQALRIAEGRSVDDHLVRISELWSRFSAVAAANLNAWSRESYTAEEIRTPGPENRMIGWPYPKLMNSNNMVEQGAATFVCSVEKAEALGIPRDRWVFPLSGTDAHDTYAVTERPTLSGSPAIRCAGARALELAGRGIDDIGIVDLYSCFPSAVQVAANELGLAIDDPARPLTVTGGLTFAGGPWNNYVTHSIATMATRLREAAAGTVGLVTANGGFLTKHAMGLYATEPPAEGFRWEDVQAEVDKVPSTQSVSEWEGPVTLESWTVMHDREGAPEAAFASVRTADDARTWALSRDADVIATLLTDDPAGAKATLDLEGTLRF
jgi:acetyl-CoA C-acetyltransferase